MAGKIYLDKVRKTCPYCFIEFTPHPKVGDRQVCCGRESCKRQRKKDADRKWRKKNPDYFKCRYQTYIKPWLEKHPGYLKDYRRKKKNIFSVCNIDIQDELTYAKTMSSSKYLYDIQDKLTSVNSMNYLVFNKLRDIQDELTALCALPGKGLS